MLQVVVGDPRMRIEVEKGLVLFPKREQKLCEQRVLDHIGKVAGVELVTIGEHEKNGTEFKWRL